MHSLEGGDVIGVLSSSIVASATEDSGTETQEAELDQENLANWKYQEEEKAEYDCTQQIGLGCYKDSLSLTCVMCHVSCVN